MDDFTAEELAAAVQTFDARYGEMERALWCLSMHARNSLLQYERPDVVEALIWTIRGWWGVQGVHHETRSAMAQALMHASWSADMFEPVTSPPPGAEDDAANMVAELVQHCLERGVPRREYSLASKALHWLLPWRIPVYDSFVRLRVGVPESWDDRAAYARVTNRVFKSAREIADLDPVVMGSIEPRSALRVLDKYLWWSGGGDTGTAVEVKHPWRVIDDLGLPRL